jgi:hypothetical protein
VVVFFFLAELISNILIMLRTAFGLVLVTLRNVTVGVSLTTALLAGTDLITLVVAMTRRIAGRNTGREFRGLTGTIGATGNASMEDFVIELFLGVRLIILEGIFLLLRLRLLNLFFFFSVDAILGARAGTDVNFFPVIFLQTNDTRKNNVDNL